MRKLMTADTSETGYFLFSLDTELAWGHYDCFNPQMFSADGRRERKAIERLIELLDEFQIAATWAVVGHLFYACFEDVPPESAINWTGKYPHFEQLYRKSSPLLYGADIIETITSGPRHEIAFHGYSHRVLQEDVCSASEVELEITEWLKVAGRNKVVPRSVVFPRNKIGYLELFKEYGFTGYRGPERLTRRYRLPVIGRFFRRYYYLVDSVFTPLTYTVSSNGAGLVNLPSSRWLFGFDRRVDGVLDKLGLRRLRIQKFVDGVANAAWEKKVIHYWAHPYEFRTDHDFEKLRYLLQSVAKEVRDGRLRSVCMAELTRRLSIS